MNTPETIAAFIAARAPEARYTNECPCCGAAHTLPNCPTWHTGAGEPLIAGLRKELAQAQARAAFYESEAAALDALHTQAVDERDELAEEIERYIAKFGSLSQL